MSTVTDVLDEARSTYLNDASGNKYTDARMLPILRTAHGFLQTKLQGMGLSPAMEEETKVITAGDKEWFPLPKNLIIPIYMEERASGTTDEFRPMSFYPFKLPSVTAGAYLNSWTWRTDRLYLGEATVDREAKVCFRKSFPVPNVASAQLFGKAEQFLAAKSAALALIFIDQAKTLAQVANDVAENELSEVVSLIVKQKQAAPVRRKPYIPHRMR